MTEKRECGTCRWYCPEEQFCVEHDKFYRSENGKKCEEWESKAKRRLEVVTKDGRAQGGLDPRR